MKRIRSVYIILILTSLTLLCYSFISENPFFTITAKDVELKIPKGFPKPFYTFKNNQPDHNIFVLGRKLFYDNILSKDYSVNCGTCHQRFAAFAHIDHRLSHGIYAKIGTRNVPALQNLIWKDTYMWDGGVNNLEVQPLNPITSPIEMDESLVNVISKLKREKTYVTLFEKAYHDTLINSERLLKALAQFTGLMISSDSRYDRFINGTDTFSRAEKNGLTLFRAKCGNCHKEPLFTDNSYRNNGLATDTTLKDSGREAVTGNAADRGSFKVPGLRNIAMTYPYMHDGRFKNLNDVLDHYNTLHPTNAITDRLISEIGSLSKSDKTQIIAFLNTLTDKTFLYDRRFADPGMHQ